MRRRRILELPLLLALLSLTVLTWFIAPASASILLVPSPEYPTIQSAVDAASPGDTIQVAAGIYYENVVVTCRQITIVGENPMTTIVDAEGKDTVFNIREDDVEVSNFTIRNGGRNYNGIIIVYPYGGAVIRYNRIMHNRLGIILSESDGNTIEGNVLLNNSLYGITARDYSDNIIIKDNVISESAYGIELSDASLSQVVENNVSDTSYGVYVAYSNDNNVSANTLTNNSWNLYLTYSNSNVVGDNAVSGGSIGIEVMHSQGNSILNNTVNVDSYGIYLGYCSASTLGGNLVSLCDWGIELYTSTGSTIKENRISDNTWGIYITDESDGNTIYHNNFIDNVKQAYQHPTSINTWHTPTTPYQANYWNDYIGEDTNGDGIGDTYLPWAGVDWYPLMTGWGGVHNVAIVDVTPSTTIVPSGDIVYINVTAKNEGTWGESFDVTAKYDDTEIGTQTVAELAPEASRTLTFEWNTTDVALGDHTIVAVASAVYSEIDTADNTYIDGVVTVGVHDVAIIGLRASPRAASPGDLIYIDVTVQNQGDYAESFNVTVYADMNATIVGDEITVGNQTVYDLLPGANQTLEFIWNTTDVRRGNYWISAEADEVPSEIDTADNILKCGAFIGGIYGPYQKPEVNILALLAPLALAISIVVLLGMAVVFFVKALMSPRLRLPWNRHINVFKIHPESFSK